jgi:mycothiol synthase
MPSGPAGGYLVLRGSAEHGSGSEPLPIAFPTMALPDGYELRAPTRDELHAVANVLVADEIDDGGQVVLGADFIQGAWSRPDFDLTTDAWVAVDGAGTVVGYAQARHEPTLVESWGVVHPTHRGRGIGSSLFGRVEERAVRLLDGQADGRFRHSINAGDRAAASMLQERGLGPIRHFWHMQIDLTGPVEAGPAPDGIEISAIEAPDDLPVVHAILVDAFVDDRGHHPEPFEAWVEEEATGPRFDPDLWLLAKEDGQAVGGLSGGPGVSPGARRGRGAPAALVRHARASRCRARAGQRRRGEPHQGHGPVRACRDADRQAMGPVGAFAGIEVAAVASASISGSTRAQRSVAADG